MIAVNPYEDIVSYESYLQQCGLNFVERDSWLYVGERPQKKGWMFVLSVIKIHMKPLLDQLQPILSNGNLPFVIVRDSLVHHCVNLGIYGKEKIGHVIVIYPDLEDDVIQLLTRLYLLTTAFNGPVVKNALQLNSSLFINQYEILKNRTGKRVRRVFVPPISMIPEELHCKQPVNYSDKHLFARRCYFNTRIIRESPKGNIYSISSLWHFGRKLIIKQGNLNMVDDYSGRTIKDRLLWQRKVLSDLWGKAAVPKVVDFFDVGGNCYLVMSYMKGEVLEDTVRKIHKESNWRDLSLEVRVGLLNYYRLVLRCVIVLHDEGYVHRDLKHENLMITKEGNPVILDFELSWSLVKREPNPPFLVKSPGYQAPEQLQQVEPSVKEDVYSCGALLYYLLSGKHPKKIRDQGDLESLLVHGVDNRFINIIKSCMAIDPSHRPHMPDLIQQIEAIIKS